MSEHTPGPWELIWEDGKYGVIGAQTEKKLVAIVGNNPNDGLNDIRRANARLIAAAPDMLAALEAICEHANEAWAALDHDYHEVLAGNLGDAVDQARAALAKAKGADHAATPTD